MMVRSDNSLICPKLITTSAKLALSLCMLEKTILNAAINTFYLGPSINGVYWVRDFTNKIFRQVYSDSPDFFQLYVIPSSVARHYNGSPLDRMRTRDTVCMCIFSFSSCIVSSWSLSILVFPGLMPHVKCLWNFNILSGDGCMLIDVGQFDTNT